MHNIYTILHLGILRVGEEQQAQFQHILETSGIGLIQLDITGKEN